MYKLPHPSPLLTTKNLVFNMVNFASIQRMNKQIDDLIKSDAYKALKDGRTK
jgi:hypothetical protein